jgi:Double zinc ribbon
LATLACSRCRQLVDSQAITCPYCRITLKAYGHPGIPLHRSNGNSYLCESCVYAQDDSCNFPQRPYARDCTLYQNLEESKLQLQEKMDARGLSIKVKHCFKRHQALVLILFVFLVCLLIALSAS